MAFERLSEKKVIATNLGDFISAQLILVKKAENQRNLEDESRFSRAVLEDDLSLEDQLSYRQDQLKRVSSGNREEKRRIKNEIASLKDQIQVKKFNDEYIVQVDALNSGFQSIDKTIEWLNKRLSRTTDEAIKTSIRESLSNLKAQKYTQQKNALQSQTEYANNDKSEEVVTKQIGRINSMRAEAVKAGNDDYVALLDLQLQSLNKTMTENKISKAMLDLSVSTMTGQSSLALLNAFNNEIANADVNTPITIGGNRYESAQQFWSAQRNEYLNDNTANGFFTRFSAELSDKVNFKATKGILNNDTFVDAQAWYDGIKTRPELADYMEKIDQEKQASLKTIADARSNSILNEFAIKLDAKKAINDLSHIQDTYGVDLTTSYQKIIQSAANEKEGQVREILSTMQSILANDPSLSNEQALKMAVESGAGAQFSPEDLATKKASDIITTAGDTATNQQFGEDVTGTTVSPSAEGKTFASPQGLNDGDLVKMNNSNTVYKYENGKLRTFTGNFTPETFKQTTGKDFSAVKTVNNISGIPTGTPINAAEINPITPEQRGDKILNPDQLQYFKPQDIITVGQEKYLKSGVSNPFGKLLSPTEFSQMQKESNPNDLEKKIIRAGKDIFLRQ